MKRLRETVFDHAASQAQAMTAVRRASRMVDIGEGHGFVLRECLEGFRHRGVALGAADQRLDEHSLRIPPQDPAAQRALADVQGEDFLEVLGLRGMIQPDHHAQGARLRQLLIGPARQVKDTPLNVLAGAWMVDIGASLVRSSRERERLITRFP